MRKILIFLIVLFAAVSSVNGQSGFELNTGFIKPFPILGYISPTTSGSSANYNLSFFISTAYKVKAGDNLFLVLDLSYNNYRLDFYERNALHPGLDESINDLRYNFNYLNLYLYPELVFGNKLEFYINAGITGGLLLNGTKSGLHINARAHEGPDGTYIEYTETDVDGTAKEDLRSFTLGAQLGTGLRYHISDKWGIHLKTSARSIPFPVENEFTQSQVDLLISVGAVYTLKRKR